MLYIEKQMRERPELVSVKCEDGKPVAYIGGERYDDYANLRITGSSGGNQCDLEADVVEHGVFPGTRNEIFSETKNEISCVNIIFFADEIKVEITYGIDWEEGCIICPLHIDGKNGHSITIRETYIPEPDID